MNNSCTYSLFNFRFICKIGASSDRIVCICIYITANTIK